MEFTGTIANFNSAFQTTLHEFTGLGSEGSPTTVYGVTSSVIAPVDFVQAISAIVSCDTPAATSDLSPQSGTAGSNPPADLATSLTPAQISDVYDVTPLTSGGSSGAGVSIGLVSGGVFGSVDVQTFWQSLGIARADPVVVETMEPPSLSVMESTIDVEWSGAMAPEASVTVYEGPDRSDTSLIYTFHEAIGRAEVQIVSDSYGTTEGSRGAAVGAAYDAAAREAAALGITVLASSGDHAVADLPSASPYVTAVGGTVLTFDDGGTGFAEIAWSKSGCGITSFDLPSWQSAVATGACRVTADVSLNAEDYWTYYLGSWGHAGGTSFSSPIFAGILADVQSARRAAGKPAIGYLNPILYTTAAVQAAFRDITQEGTATYSAGDGWDPPTGWGVVQAGELTNALP